MRFQTGIAGTGDEFDPQDPSTWAGATIIAEYALKPQEPVVSGAPLGSDISFAAAQTNLSAVNVAGSQLTQGQFLFVEDSTDAQNAVANFGDDFIRNVDDVSGPLVDKTDEAILAEIDQTLLLTALASLGLDGADLTVMNAFAAAAFTGAGEDLGGSDPINAFASGLGGAAVTDFDAADSSSAFATGDFTATLGVDVHIGHQVTPEPSSLVLLCMGVSGLGLFGGVRRRRNRKSLEN